MRHYILSFIGILILGCLVESSSLYAQEIYPIRKLKIFNESIDSTIVKLKMDNDGFIIKLEQQYFENSTEDSYFEEQFKRGKYWALYHYVFNKDKRRRTEYVLHGPQLNFDEEGKVISMMIYNMGKEPDVYLSYEYYPDGYAKIISEIKDGRYWNILYYKKPNGTDFHFGDFVNGQGIIIFLNDLGCPCIERVVIGKKIKDNYLPCGDETIF
jgi:hypothetical protein